LKPRLLVPEPISDTDKILAQPHGDILPLVTDGHDANHAVWEFAEEEINAARIL